MRVKSLTDTLAATLPRIEFCYLGIPRATLTPAGLLGADFTDTSPEAAMRMQNDVDLFAVREDFRAVSVSDDL